MHKLGGRSYYRQAMSEFQQHNLDLTPLYRGMRHVWIWFYDETFGKKQCDRTKDQSIAVGL